MLFRLCYCFSRYIKTDKGFIAYLLANLEGFWCEDCGAVNRHFMCLNCICNLQEGGNRTAIAPGLPHQKLLKQCKVKKGWFFYVKGSSMRGSST
jgi:hypothetical protein